jgi:hypothetical protein
MCLEQSRLFPRDPGGVGVIAPAHRVIMAMRGPHEGALILGAGPGSEDRDGRGRHNDLRGGCSDEAGLLASAYRRSPEVAVERDVRTIAFPLISTGAYRFPIGAACRIALRETGSLLARIETIQRVFIVCFASEALETCRSVAREA